MPTTERTMPHQAMAFGPRLPVTCMIPSTNPTKPNTTPTTNKLKRNAMIPSARLAIARPRRGGAGGTGDGELEFTGRLMTNDDQRNPKEIQITKSENRSLTSKPEHCVRAVDFSSFGFRVSDFLRISAFGFR